MNRATFCLALALALSPSLAGAADVCILHEDDGEILVIKGVGRGSKSVHGYVAEFLGGESFNFYPFSGSTLMDREGNLVAGLTQFHSPLGGGFTENVSFHRVTCDPGANFRLDVLDDCQNIEKNTDHLPTQDIHSAHVVACKDIPAKP